MIWRIFPGVKQYSLHHLVQCFLSLIRNSQILHLYFSGSTQHLRKAGYDLDDLHRDRSGWASPGADAAVGGPVDCVGQHSPLERDVVRHHSGREVVVHALAGFQHTVQLRLAVLGHYLPSEMEA